MLSDDFFAILSCLKMPLATYLEKATFGVWDTQNCKHTTKFLQRISKLDCIPQKCNLGAYSGANVQCFIGKYSIL